MLMLSACNSGDVKQPDITPTPEVEEAESIADITKATDITPTPEPTEEPPAEKEASNMQKKVAVVLSRDRYASQEYAPVADALKEAGYQVVIAGDSLGTAQRKTQKLKSLLRMSIRMNSQASY